MSRIAKGVLLIVLIAACGYCAYNAGFTIGFAGTQTD